MSIVKTYVYLFSTFDFKFFAVLDIFSLVSDCFSFSLDFKFVALQFNLAKNFNGEQSIISAE
ncbi:uncharacterized protein METZ01_LOCUS412018 [marine metagenome]|uniref:Uncharacterized protein n=1 Tax=marine metagenome TaxID=408172 RepID=A0A382WKN4_9ZZZZ